MRTAFYTPMCNAAERTNRTLITCVRSLLDDDQREWDINIQQIVHAINTAKHETLGCSPYFCNFGRDHILYTDQYPLAKLNSAANSASAQRVRTKYAQNIQHFVVTKIRAAHNNSKKRYDLRARSRAFAVGDIVWRRSFELSNAAEHRTKKLGPKFIPCIVRQVQGSNNYMLDDIKTSKTGVYHSKDIKAD